LRGLGIPCMLDRAQQALYQLALDPIAETILNPNSYGFRRGRWPLEGPLSTADAKVALRGAIESCFNALSRKDAATWILECDLERCTPSKGCPFDTISHEWMGANVPTDKRMLNQWLKSGYIEAQAFHPTEHHPPRGRDYPPYAMANLAQAAKYDERSPHPFGCSR